MKYPAESKRTHLVKKQNRRKNASETRRNKIRRKNPKKIVKYLEKLKNLFIEARSRSKQACPSSRTHTHTHTIRKNEERNTKILFCSTSSPENKNASRTTTESKNLKPLRLKEEA